MADPNRINGWSSQKVELLQRTHMPHRVAEKAGHVAVAYQLVATG